MTDKRLKILVFMAICFISSSAILVKLSQASAIEIAFFRLFFSTLFLMPFFIVSKNNFKNLTVSTILLCILSGLFLALHFIVWFASLNYTSVANSTVLVTMSPIFTVIGGALFLKDYISKKQITLIIITLIGSFIMTFHQLSIHPSELVGDLLAFLGALFVAIYMLIGRKTRQSITTVTYTFLVYGSATIVLGFIGFINKQNFITHSKTDWLIFIGLALFPTLLGHSIFSWALKYVKASFISVVTLLEPVFSTVLAIFIFIEIPDILQMIGATIILISIGQYTRLTEIE